MRIAILCHARHPVAAPFKGGMEAHSWLLADGLRRRGHDVTLFAAGDSDPDFDVWPILERHYEIDLPWHDHHGGEALTQLLDTAYDRACHQIGRGGYDLVHNNSLHRFPLRTEWTDRTPTVTSLHVPPYRALHGFVSQSLGPRHHVTVTSGRQMQAWFPEGAPEDASVLHNGIDLAAWPYRAEGDGTASWVGRIGPNKGPHLAIQAARTAGVPITLYGPIDDLGYWRDAVEPLLGPDARYAGHLDGPALARAIGGASVHLFTPCWDEPFGLVAVEAMACGLPIAAFDAGAAREVIGQAGVLAPPGDVDGLAVSIRRAMAIPRALCRARAETRFGRDRWLDGCEALYARVRQGTPALSAVA